MFEKKIQLDNINPTDFFGINDLNINILRDSFPKIKIITRGTSIKVIGEEEQIHIFETKLKLLIDFYNRFHRLTTNDIQQLLTTDYQSVDELDVARNSDILVYGVSGKPVKPKTIHQKEIVKAFEKNDLVFAIGPAGTGKTYIAIALALKALRETVWCNA